MPSSTKFSHSGLNPKIHSSSLGQSSFLSLESMESRLPNLTPLARNHPILKVHSSFLSCLSTSYSTPSPPNKTNVGTSSSLGRTPEPSSAKGNFAGISPTLGHPDCARAFHCWSICHSQGGAVGGTSILISCCGDAHSLELALGPDWSPILCSIVSLGLRILHWMNFHCRCLMKSSGNSGVRDGTTASPTKT